MLHAVFGTIILGSVYLGAVTTASAAASVDADAIQKCARIENKEARLVCFDAVATALQNAEKARSERASAEDEADRQRRQAEQKAREAQIAAREAELARREAALEANRARLDASRRAEEERLRQATRQAEEAAKRAEAEAARAQAQAETAEKRAKSESRSRLLASGLPQALPMLFGIDDLPRDKAAKILSEVDYEDLLSRDEILDEITMPVAKFGYNSRDRAYVVLEDGQMWRQADPRHAVRFPGKQTKTVQIRRGSVGSYFMHINGKGRAIKVKRVR